MRIKKSSLCLLCLFVSVLLMHRSWNIHAQEDFAGQEEYYEEYCAIPRNNDTESQVCASFQSYMKDKAQEARRQLDQLSGDLGTVQADIEEIEHQIVSYQAVIEVLESTIYQYQDTISKIESNLETLAKDIEVTEIAIEKRDQMIKTRMASEQPNVGINTYIEVLMGSKDLLDLIRNLNGLQSITENDQAEIEELSDDKEKLSIQKQEQNRLKQDAQDKKIVVEQQKEVQEDAMAEYEELLETYKKQEADLIQAKRSAQSAADAVQNAVIGQHNSSDLANVTMSGDWTRPVPGGFTAGTFYYSWGAFHAGVDFAAGIHAPIQAPINGVIVYSSNPFGTTSGSFPDNWDGYPAGAGNSIHMIGQVDGVTYGISFFHMAQENWISYPGQEISQGQVMGYTGSSGHVMGPHLHLEIINLGNMSMADAIARFQSTIDFSWGTGWYSESTSCDARGGATPCRERPENFF